MGFLVTAIILFIMFRNKQSELPSPYVMIILAVFFLSTVIDGLSSYLGLYGTNNVIRFSTGVLSGSAIMVMLYPVFNFQYYEEKVKERIFRKPVTFIVFFLILVAFIVLSLFQLDFLGSFYYYFSGISVIFTFFFVSLVIMFLIPGFSQRAGKLFTRHLIFPIVFALVLTALELFITYKIHELLNQFVA